MLKVLHERPYCKSVNCRSMLAFISSAKAKAHAPQHVDLHRFRTRRGDSLVWMRGIQYHHCALGLRDLIDFRD